jgi:hypothetical protein
LVRNGSGTRIVFGRERSFLSLDMMDVGTVFPSAFNTIGDFSGDGLADVILTDIRLDQDRIFLGGTIGLMAGWTPGAGTRIMPVGDTNADGFSDIAYFVRSSLVVATGSSRGTPASLVELSFNSEAEAGVGNQRAIFSPGDTNGDVYADIVVGASGVDSVFVYHGQPPGPPNMPSVTLTGARGSSFGISLGTPQ